MNRKLSYPSVFAMLFMALTIGFSSCKNKKKTSEVSDPQKERAEIEQEMEEEEDTREAVKEPSTTQKLDTYFAAVANATSTTSANGTISEALRMFSSPDAPVLIVIYRGDGTTDYDEPTTIKRYLEYLKDTKNNAAKVDEMVMDDYGKIKELVLKK